MAKHYMEVRVRCFLASSGLCFNSNVLLKNANSWLTDPP